MVRAGDLDRRIQFLRAAIVDDGYSKSETWADEDGPTYHGSVIAAQKTDLSDGEKWRAGEIAATVSARFVVRYSTFTKGITPQDRLECEGVVYEINGIKEGQGRRQWLELTCTARSD